MILHHGILVFSILLHDVVVVSKLHNLYKNIRRTEGLIIISSIRRICRCFVTARDPTRASSPMERLQRIAAALRPVSTASAAPRAAASGGSASSASCGGELALPLNVTGGANDNWPPLPVPRGREERHGFNEYLGGANIGGDFELSAKTFHRQWPGAPRPPRAVAAMLAAVRGGSFCSESIYP